MNRPTRRTLKRLARKMRQHRRAARRLDQAVPSMQMLEPRLLLSGDSAILCWQTDNGGNGHYYQVLTASQGISWTDAQAAAEALGGHLATITSAGENAFIYDMADDPDYWNELTSTFSIGPWLGGFKAEATADPSEGWQWVTGEPWEYDNWAIYEPDRTNELYVHFAGRGEITDDEWANWVNNHGRYPIYSYVVEWNPGDQPSTNEAPAFTSDPLTEASEGAEYVYELSATDANGDPLTFDSSTLPDWLTLTDHGDGTATLSGTAAFADAGMHDVVISLSDGTETVEQSFSIEVMPTTSQISGTVWHDVDADGVIDDGEQRLSGWRVYADANSNGQFDDGEQFQMTAADGSYTLEGLVPGQWDIRTVAANDTSGLNDFMIHCSWRNTFLDFAEGEMVQRTDLDANSYLLGFEDWRDGDFDDLIMRIDQTDMGRLTMTVVERNAAGHFDLVDAATHDRILRHLGEWNHNPVGTQFVVAEGWDFTTDAGEMYRVTTEAGMMVSSADFGVQVAQTQPTTPSWEAEALNQFKIHCQWRNTYLSLEAGDMVQRTDLADGTYLLGFEDWTDNDFNDLVLHVNEQGDGQVTVTVHDRNAAGKFNLIDADGDVLANRLGERAFTPIGTQFDLTIVDAVETGGDGLSRLTYDQIYTPSVQTAQADPVVESVTEPAAEEPASEPMAAPSTGNGAPDVLALAAVGQRLGATADPLSQAAGGMARMTAQFQQAAAATNPLAMVGSDAGDLLDGGDLVDLLSL